MDSIYVSHVWLQMKQEGAISGDYPNFEVAIRRSLVDILKPKDYDFPIRKELDIFDIDDVVSESKIHSYYILEFYNFLCFFRFPSAYIEHIIQNKMIDTRNWSEFEELDINGIYLKLNSVLGDYKKWNFELANLIYTKWFNNVC